MCFDFRRWNDYTFTIHSFGSNFNVFYNKFSAWNGKIQFII